MLRRMLRKARSWVGTLMLHRVLRRIELGTLTLTYSDTGERHTFGDARGPVHASLVIHDRHLAWEILTLSELGLGMGYVRGGWTSQSPYHVLLVLMLNESKLRSVIMRGYRLDPAAFRTVSRLRRNVCRSRLIEHCREQIGLTYDVGNDFYRWMLGPSMTYSCAIWPREDATLEEAQQYKMDIILDKLGIEPGHSVLDIGCGWGTLCAHIADRTGARVRGIGLSRNQIEGCRERFPHLDFAYLDYREETGRYDRIVSVGMVEHVGPENLPLYCDRLVELLVPGGRCLIHWVGPWNDILIDERRSRHPNWASVLMPGAESPTHSQLIAAAMNTGQLRLLHVETFGIHYARTGEHWLENLEAHREEILERYPLEVLKSHAYAWQLGRAALETGYGLVQMVLERRPYGAPVWTSAVDASAARASALSGRREVERVHRMGTDGRSVNSP